MTRWLWGLGLGLVAIVDTSPAAAQGYRLRVDSRVQSVSWRGVVAGSIPRAAAVPQPGGGFLTPEGHAALCGADLCTFFAPGPTIRGVPWVSQADLSAWGFGMPGLSARASARLASDLTDEATWPGSDPAVQVTEAYLEYARERWTARAGRHLLTSRLGSYGLDGGRLAWRDPLRGLELVAYGGWGLARGAVVPVTSPALNPLDDFQPRDRQLAVGAEAALTSRVVDGRLEYRREVDPAVDYLVSERAAASLVLRPLPPLGLSAGAEYDLAFGHVGSADLLLSWAGRGYTLATGWRRYQPFFDLWTIWGAFSPVAHHAVHAAGSWGPASGVTVRARGERYRFENAAVATPNVSVEHEGWRLEAGAGWRPGAHWTFDGSYHAEFGPGAAARGFEAQVTWLPLDALGVTAEVGRTRRPLELRYSDADLVRIGGRIEYRHDSRWRFGLDLARWSEERERPDAGALDWNQVRVAARVTVMLGSNPDRLSLPRAVPGDPGARP